MPQEPTVPATGKILVVDDNPIIQRAVYFQFRDKGFKVFMAGDLTQSMTTIRAEKPDVILLDITFLQEDSLTTDAHDGYWGIGWLRRMDDSKGIPIIVISGGKPEEVGPRALAAGAVAFFPKPIDNEKLLAKIREVMAQKKPESSNTSFLRMAS